MEPKKGEKKTDTRNRRPQTTVDSPVLAPALMAAEDSGEMSTGAAWNRPAIT
jgi:hypothetical protein